MQVRLIEHAPWQCKKVTGFRGQAWHGKVKPVHLLQLPPEDGEEPPDDPPDEEPSDDPPDDDPPLEPPPSRADPETGLPAVPWPGPAGTLPP